MRRDDYWRWWGPRLVGVAIVCLLLLGGLTWGALGLFPGAYGPDDHSPVVTTQPTPPAGNQDASLSVGLVAACHGSDGMAVEPLLGSKNAQEGRWATYVVRIEAKKPIKVVKEEFDLEAVGVGDGPRGPYTCGKTQDPPPNSWSIEWKGKQLNLPFWDLGARPFQIGPGETGLLGLIVKADSPKEVWGSSVTVTYSLADNTSGSYQLKAELPGLYCMP